LVTHAVDRLIAVMGTVAARLPPAAAPVGPGRKRRRGGAADEAGALVLLVVVAMSSISTLVTTSVPSLKLWGLQQACGTDRGSLRALIACHILGVGTAATISVVVALVTENGTRYQVFDDALDMIPVLNMLVLSCMTNNDWLLH
jgi:hypothetical protein